MCEIACLGPEPEDVVWALRSVKDGSEMAVQDKCEMCFKVWSQAFSMHSWPTFCEEVAKKPDVKKNFQDAKASMSKPHEKKPWPSQSVSNLIETQFEVTKKFIVLSLDELKKHVGARAISKKQLEGIPVMQLMGNMGLEEDCYVFEHPQHPHREAAVRRWKGVAYNCVAMAPEAMIWKDQGVTTWQHTQKLMSENCGALSLTKVGSLDAFKAKMSAACASSNQNEKETEEPDEVVEVDDDTAPLVGMAAAEMPPPALQLPMVAAKKDATKKFTPKKGRKGSSENLSDAVSTAAPSSKASSVDGDTSSETSGAMLRGGDLAETHNWRGS